MSNDIAFTIVILTLFGLFSNFIAFSLGGSIASLFSLALAFGIMPWIIFMGINSVIRSGEWNFIYLLTLIFYIDFIIRVIIVETRHLQDKKKRMQRRQELKEQERKTSDVV